MAQFDLTNAVPFNEQPLYKQGYEDAIEKACEWIEDRFGESYLEYFRTTMMEE